MFTIKDILSQWDAIHPVIIRLFFYHLSEKNKNPFTKGETSVRDCESKVAVKQPGSQKACPLF